MKAYKITTCTFWQLNIELRNITAVGKIGFSPFISNGLLLEAGILVKSSVAGRQIFRMHVFNDRGVMWMCTVSHTYCFNGPSALVLSAVVIHRIMVKMLFVFLFSETFSK